MKRRVPRRLNALSCALMLKALADIPCTVYDLCEISGLSVHTARHWLLTLHKERVIYIAGWEQDSIGRYTTQAYMLGNERDMKKPPRRDRNAWRRSQTAKRQQMRIQSALAGQ